MEEFSAISGLGELGEAKILMTIAALYLVLNQPLVHVSRA